MIRGHFDDKLKNYRLKYYLLVSLFSFCARRQLLYLLASEALYRSYVLMSLALCISTHNPESGLMIRANPCEHLNEELIFFSRSPDFVEE